MKDLNTYILNLEKGIKDKLFFLKEIDLSEYDLIVDYGCADGKLIRRIDAYIRTHEFNPYVSLIGYDTNLEMIRLAKEISHHCDGDGNISFTNDWNHLINVKNKLKEKGFHKGKALIIFSSVLHEIGKENHKKVINQMRKFDTIVIRDMKAPEKDSEPIDTTRTRRKIASRVPKYMIKEFEKVWGKIDNKRAMYHFFLKYTYVENWDTELLEDYFSAPWSEIHHELVFSEEYEIVYENSYTLEYKRKMVKKDFDHLMRSSTHKKLILTKK